MNQINRINVNFMATILTLDDWLNESEYGSDKTQTFTEKIFTELKRRDLNYALESTPRQLQGGTILFIFNGEDSKSLINRAIKEYGIEQYLIDHNKAKVLSNLHTGTPYTIRRNGDSIMIKHKTGPGWQVEYPFDDKGIEDAIEWIEENAKRYLVKLTVDQGIVNIPEKHKMEEIPAEHLKGILTDLEVEFYSDLQKYQTSLYDHAVRNELAMEVLCILRGAKRSLHKEHWKPILIVMAKADNDISIGALRSDLYQKVSKKAKSVTTRVDDSSMSYNPSDIEKKIIAQVIDSPQKFEEIMHKCRGLIKGRNYGV